MTKNKKKRYDKVHLILTSLCLILLVASSMLLSLLLLNQEPTSAPTGQQGNIYSIGKYKYVFKDGKAIAQNNEQTQRLENVLKTEGEKNLSTNCNPVYHEVNEVSNDRTQVLLDYGCIIPRSRMFAVYVDNDWKLLTPTNQFDMFGIPACTHVNENNIAQEIAPVCFTHNQSNESKVSYSVR